MTTVAAIDRLVHHGVILELNIPSYRIEQAKMEKEEQAAGYVLKSAKPLSGPAVPPWPPAATGSNPGPLNGNLRHNRTLRTPREIIARPEILIDAGQVSGVFAADGGRVGRRGEGLLDASFVPLGDVWPTELGLLGLGQIVRDGSLAGLTAVGDLALGESEASEPQDGSFIPIPDPSPKYS